MTLGERIQRYRKRDGMSQEQLSERLGVSRQAVSKWELNAAMPDVDKLVLLAQVFGVSTDALLNGEAAPAGVETAKGPGKPRPWYLLGILPIVAGALLLVRGVLSAVAAATVLNAAQSVGAAIPGMAVDIAGLPDGMSGAFSGGAGAVEELFTAAVYVPLILQCVVGALLAVAGVLVLLLGRRRWRQSVD